MNFINLKFEVTLFVFYVLVCLVLFRILYFIMIFFPIIGIYKNFRTFSYSFSVLWGLYYTRFFVFSFWYFILFVYFISGSTYYSICV